MFVRRLDGVDTGPQDFRMTTKESTMDDEVLSPSDDRQVAVLKVEIRMPGGHLVLLEGRGATIRAEVCVHSDDSRAHLDGEAGG